MGIQPLFDHSQGWGTHYLTRQSPLGWVAEMVEKLEMKNPTSIYSSLSGSEE